MDPVFREISAFAEVREVLMEEFVVEIGAVVILVRIEGTLSDV